MDGETAGFNLPPANKPDAHTCAIDFSRHILTLVINQSDEILVCDRMNRIENIFVIEDQMAKEGAKQ